MKKFKQKLIGSRVVLKITKPSVEMASVIFALISVNRKHLRPWFPWEKLTKKMDDSFKYLVEKEEKFKKGEKVEYGIYINNEYAGNIGLFDISSEKKSAEIGYWLATKFIRQGYMTEAVRVLEKEAFINLGINRIQIRCDERNIASSSVAKKCGYFFEGRHRADSFSKYFKDFRNTLVFSKLNKEFKKEKKK